MLSTSITNNWPCSITNNCFIVSTAAVPCIFGHFSTVGRGRSMKRLVIIMGQKPKIEEAVEPKIEGKGRRKRGKREEKRSVHNRRD
ncbi:hypothetical protein PanWU01x14_355660 [Parasponia andersonii]|uniref:Uncharacterized protein n=1 Tax=Parasponia andersonii TaxID=3476 RepID=A0A2P5A995_PARAD|nr:hypothetical protein PanWU01x14_355660 [Parasponia andersonii]